MSTQVPSIGRIVHVTLDAHSADQINKRRDDGRCLDGDGKTFAERETGAQIHFGNPVAEGDVFPMVITRVWNTDPGTVNGQVLLDGNDTLWLTSVTPGEPGEPFRYFWPARV